MPPIDRANAASKCVADGVACLERRDAPAADELVDRALEHLGLASDSLDRTGCELMHAMRPEAGQALARVLWLGSTVDELLERTDRARLRCLRAMELYARLRLPSEAIDMRAARELGAASARLGATSTRR